MKKLLFSTLLSLSVLFSFAQIDYRVEDVRAVTTSGGPHSPSASIPTGTSLDSVTFLLRNNSASSVPSGTTVTVDLTIGSGSAIALQGTLSASLAAGQATKFFINCTSGGLNENFPSSAGSFQICVESTTVNDPVSSNNTSCSSYSMSSPTSNSYDFRVTGVEVTDPTGLSIGSSIQIGTQLNEIQFDIVNGGNNTIPANTIWSAELTIGGAQTDTVFYRIPINLTSGATLSNIRINCTPAQFDKNFPSSPGSFAIRLKSLYDPDPNVSNNTGTAAYVMQGSGSPQITGISPTSGQVGSTVIISGNNFPTTISSVRFNPGITASVISNSSTSIEVTVPSGAQTGAIQVNFSTVSLNTPVFTVTSSPVHTITGINPTAGPIGSQVSISGTNFSSNPNDHTVLFGGGTQAVVNNAGPTLLLVTVPGGAQSGPIEVILNSISVSSQQSFSITSSALHTITAINPNSGDVGDTVNITGTNFETTIANNTVRFGGGVQAIVLNASNTVLQTVVPAGAQSGNIEVEIAGNSVQSPQIFRVNGSPLPPEITDFNPKKGAAGMQLTITGNNFSSTLQDNTVTFSGGIAANLVSATRSKIVVEVPTGANNGPISVSVNGNSILSTSSFIYTTDPVISYFTPNTGPHGSGVTIHGANFDPVSANNEVFFGAISAATPIASSDGLRLITNVPSSVGVGFVPLSVRVNGTTVIADEEFNVVIASVEELGEAADLKVFYKDQTLRVYSGTNSNWKDLKVNVYLIDGKLIHSSEIEEKSVPWQQDIPVVLKPGVYILDLESTSGSLSKKFSVR